MTIFCCESRVALSELCTQKTVRCAPALWFATTKKGFIVNSDDKHAVSKIERLNVSYYYTYNINPIPDIKIHFTPMLGDLNDFCKLHDLSHSYSTILGFNEPDRNGVNITVKDALNSWKLFEDPNIHFKIISPATYENPLNHGSWLQEFLRGNSGREAPRVDVIAFHACYPPGYNGDVDIRVKKVMSILDDLYYMFHKPIWVTELGIDDLNGNYTEYDVMEYMEKIIKEMDNRDYIERFYWKDQSVKDPRGIGDLFNENGKITRLGELYSIL